MSDQAIHNPDFSLKDKEVFRISSFLADLVGQGTWNDLPLGDADGQHKNETSFPSFQEYRRLLRESAADIESALVVLRRLRVRTLLALAKADLEGRIKPYQIRSRLLMMTEVLVQGAWWIAEKACAAILFIP